MKQFNKTQKTDQSLDENCKSKSRVNRNSKSGSNKTSRLDSRKEYSNMRMNYREIPDHNDWKFYAASEQIAKDIASLPFNYMGGTKFPINGSIKYQNDTINPKVVSPLPCLMNLNYIDSIGVTNDRTQGVNMAAVQLYTYVRHSNSGAKNYEAADLMMYVLAMRDIYAEFFELKRIYGTAGLYNYYNHNFPDLILNAMGIDADDLRSNLAQYRGNLNLLAKKINSFAVPKYFKIFDRSAYINSYIFGDSNSLRGQFYQFSRVGYYKWEPVASEKGTSLSFHFHNGFGNIANESLFGRTSNTTSKFADRLQILSQMIDALFLDEDALTMSGDLLKAFPESELYSISQTDENYVVSVIEDEDILAQIENSHAFTTGNLKITDTSFVKFDVTQSNQIIKFNPMIDFGEEGGASLPQSHIFNMETLAFNSHKDNPMYTDILEWTRLITTTKTSYTTGGFDAKIEVTSCGLELLLRYQIYSSVSPTGVENTFYSFDNCLKTEYQDSDAVGKDDTVQSNLVLSLIQQYDWHPILYVYNDDKGGSGSQIIIAADLKVATTIPSEIIYNINDAAIYGALYGNGLYNK